ncbi:MAG TPA: SOS response-associated peptidase family protein, partial [Stellaceae bacterium]|nr:SOS response-associated peptidase family protein [Stellaceae bacterium]
KPAFREAFARRRCLVPFDCFYEWKKLSKERQPYAVGLAGRRLMALAGRGESAQLRDRHDFAERAPSRIA